MPRRYGSDEDTVVVPGQDIGLTLQLQKLPVSVAECDEFEPELKPLTWANGDTDMPFVHVGGWLVPDWTDGYPFPLIAAVKGQWPIETVFTWTIEWEPTSNEIDSPPITNSYLNSVSVAPGIISPYGTSIDPGLLTVSVKIKLPKKTVSLNPITMTVIASDC